MDHLCFIAEKYESGLIVHGIDFAPNIYTDSALFWLPKYGRVDSINTPKHIIIPPYLQDNSGNLIKVTRIAGHPFENCNEMEILEIPETIQSIIWNGKHRSHLKEIRVSKNNPIFQSIDGVLYTKRGYTREGLKIRNHKELVAYPNAKGPKYFVDPETTKLGNQCFKYTDIKEVILPEGLKHIGVNAFYGCTSINEILIPKSVDIIESQGNCKTIFKKAE